MKKLLLTALFILLVAALLLSSVALKPEGCNKRNTQNCYPRVTLTSAAYTPAPVTPSPTLGSGVYTPVR